MVHEPFIAFGQGWRVNAAAGIHRMMTVLLLQAAHHVWISTPYWKHVLKPYALGRRLEFDWLPLPSNVPRRQDASAIRKVRERYAPANLLIGHFGTFKPPITPMLEEILPSLLARLQAAAVLLIGGGGDEFRTRLIEAHPSLKERIHATGFFNARDPELSAFISACDLLVQPYPDGVTSRRTTVMAALSHAKPVVTTAGAFTEAFWQTRKGVILAPEGNTPAFVDAVADTLNSPETRASVATAAKLLYDECFDIERIVNLLRQTSRCESVTA
jgi:glycosyltransferase involved in cell wall biosynthesis